MPRIEVNVEIAYCVRRTLNRSPLHEANAPVNVFCFVAQNVPNSDWEKKVTEYFKEKLKENNATNWVRLFYSFRVMPFLSFILFTF